MSDHPDDDYDLWCELHPCPNCSGTGDIPDDGYGDRTCQHCDGSGIDPASNYEGD